MPSPDPARPWAGRIVLGTWGISGAVSTAAGPAGYSHVEAAVADGVLDAAWSAGVRWLDTAGAYGAGEGLRRVAQWQRRRGLSWQVVVKPGRPPGIEGPRSAIGLDDIRRELAAQPVSEPAAVLVKDPPEAAILDGTVGRLLADLRADGHRLVGVATHRLDLLPALGSAPEGAGVLQVEYHLLNRVVAVAAVRAAAQRGWQVWGMQPLAYGFLGGRHDVERVFPADDWRSRIPPAARAAFHAGVRGLRHWLPPYATRWPPAEVALA